jgi:hypothetical protein
LRRSTLFRGKIPHFGFKPNDWCWQFEI